MVTLGTERHTGYGNRHKITAHIYRQAGARLPELTCDVRHGNGFADTGPIAGGADLPYLLTLLIHNQLRQAEEGGVPDDFVNPDILTSFEQKTLKESFQLIAKLYTEIEGEYWSGKILP